MWDAGTKQEPFSVSSEQRGHTAHLRIAGEIDMATAPVLEEWFQGAESNGNTSIVVDLGGVTFIDGSGLRPFLGASQRAIQNGRAFAITDAPAIVLRMLWITDTTHLLGADALAFSPDPTQWRKSSFAAHAMASSSDVLNDHNERVTHADRELTGASPFAGARAPVSGRDTSPTISRP